MPFSAARLRIWASQTGVLNLAIRAKVDSGKSVISITVNDENRKVINVTGNSFQTIGAGSFTIISPGYQSIDITGISSEGSSFADISEFIISGPAATGKVYLNSEWMEMHPSVKYFVSDQEGKVLLKGRLEKANASISLSGLVAGVFYVKLDYQDQCFYETLVVGK